jgi:hypothetical protein
MAELLSGNESLEPTRIMEEAVGRTKKKLTSLADTHKDNCAEMLSEWIQIICSDYWRRAQSVIANRERMVKETLREIGTLPKLVGDAGETLKADLKDTLDRRAEEYNRCRLRLRDVRADIRRLTIALTGDGNGIVAVPNTFVYVAITIMVVVAVLTIEYFLNFGVLEFATNPTTSMMFSVGMSLVATAMAHIAAICRNQVKYHRGILAEFKKNFPNGIDLETGKHVSPFPVSGIIPPVSFLSHSVFMGICLVILGIRIPIVLDNGHPEELIGSLVLIAVIAGYYTYKFFAASPYPGDIIGKYTEKLAEEEQLEERMLSTSIMMDDPDIIPIVEAYTNAITRIRQSLESKFPVLETYIRLVGETKSFPEWIDAHATTLFQLLQSHMDGRRETLHALSYSNNSTGVIDQDVLDQAEAMVENPPVIKRTEDPSVLTGDMWPEAQIQAARRAADADLLGFEPIEEAPYDRR